ncbi:LacI family DNA-binding transcriptional regulator [Micromonospora taraxaci]|uniref:LacI family DNA-binding transcriptional regulator n=1 Tax=Micromonospora taraxaci TaxID=1316803 RepID=UPI0033B0920C
MPSDPPPRMRDVARALGVSQATVSNAFNRPDQLSRELRDRILTAARDLGYPGPDPIANTFRRGRTGAIGLIIHEPLQYLFEDPAARLTMAGVARVCGEHGSSLVLVPRAEPGLPDVVPTALVDGFVAFCDPLEPERRELLRARRLPVVGLDAPVTPGEPYVGIDDRAAARAAAAHLVALGHRRIGVISFALARDSETTVVPAGLDAPTGYVANRARLDGYRDALGPALGDGGGAIVVVAARGVEEADGAAAAVPLLDHAEPPTAILAMSDRLALGVIAEATRRGIDVPGDLSVVGFDDVPAASAADPALTTVRQPHARKGAEAVRMLLRPASTRQALILPTEVVVRASTAPPRT